MNKRRMFYYLNGETNLINSLHVILVGTPSMHNSSLLRQSSVKDIKLLK